MHITNLRPSPPGSGKLAVFDVEMPTIRLFNLTLKLGADGLPRVWAPNAHGRHAASFHPDLSHEIAQAAMVALGGLGQYDHAA